MAGYYDKDRDDNPSPRVSRRARHPGLNNVGSYQMSGIPAVGTAAADETVTFERVTRAITLVSGVAATVNFNNTGQDAYTLTPDIPQRFEIMVTSMTIGVGSVNFVAELTTIGAEQCPDWDNTDNVLFEIA